MDTRKRLIGIALATIAGAPSGLPGKASARHAAGALQGSDCPDLIRTLGAKADEARLIVITSHVDSNVEVAGRAAGADCVVVKRAIAMERLPAIDHIRARRTLHSPARSPNLLGRS